MMTLSDLGVHAFNLFWGPVLVWTVAATVLLVVSRWLPRRFPQLRLDLSVGLMLALPVSLLVGGLIPDGAPGILSGVAIDVQSLPVPNPDASPITPARADVVWPWRDAIGLLTLIAGVLSMFATIRIAASWWQLRRIIKASIPVDPHLTTIRESDQVSVAFSAGLLRHWIVLPADTATEDRDTIIRHEQAHHDQGDLWRTWLSATVRSLFAFHPLVHLLDRNVALYAEICCDRRVLETSPREAQSYARLLLQQVPSTPSMQPAIPLVGSASQLKQRIEAMNIPTRLSFARWQLAGWIGAITLSVGLLAGCSDMEVGPTEPDITDEAYDLVMDLPAAKGNLASEVFVVVEDAPILLGGLAELQSRIQYPAIAEKAGVQGRVFLQFIVDQEGNVKEPQVVRGIGAGCDEEALRVLQTMKFVPGVQRGERVNVKMSLPVTFKLDGESAPTKLESPPFSKEQMEAVKVYSSVSSVEFPYVIAGGTKGPVYEGKVTEGMLWLAVRHGATAIVRGGSDFDYLEDEQLRSQMTDPDMFVFLKPVE